MAETKVIMPQMGESIFEGTITKWLKKKGDSVQRDEPLFEISTDKIDTEIPAPASGVVQDILVKEGQTVQINHRRRRDRRRNGIEPAAEPGSLQKRPRRKKLPKETAKKHRRSSRGRLDSGPTAETKAEEVC
jgi:pyruvate/2-oxoglutarate dehydrogenase complex dihydrolipoamide acyltransferase (E2) component